MSPKGWNSGVLPAEPHAHCRGHQDVAEGAHLHGSNHQGLEGANGLRAHQEGEDGGAAEPKKSRSIALYSQSRSFLDEEEMVVPRLPVLCDS